jgi:hypothetical protein
MADVLPQPPQFADLEWTVAGDKHIAPATQAFLSIFEAARERLFHIGIRREKVGGDWNVVFTARFSRHDVQQLIDGILMEVAALIEQMEAHRIEAETRRLAVERPGT